MNPIQWLKLRLLQRRHRRNPFPESKHIIKEAFTTGGITYYEFDDLFNLPYQRGLEAIAVYEEMRMKCTREYLLKHTEANADILGRQKFGVNELLEMKRLNDQLHERLEWVMDTDIVYKLASVVFFDSTEKPERYEPKYALEKIARWKKDTEVTDFFALAPLKKLVPFLGESSLNFRAYSAAQHEINQLHWANISGSSPQAGEKSSSAASSPSSATATKLN